MQEHACWVQSDDDIVDHIPRNYEVLKEPDRQYDVREGDKCCTYERIRKHCPDSDKFCFPTYFGTVDLPPS